MPVPNPDVPGEEHDRPRSLERATQDVIQVFVDVERPGGDLDTEYASLVDHLRKDGPDRFPTDLYQLAVRIDSDGLNHYQKFRDIKRILAPYAEEESVYLRDVTLAADDDPAVQEALGYLDAIVEHLRDGYMGEAGSLDTAPDNHLLSNEDRAAASRGIEGARDAMHLFNDTADQLARKGIGVPFFAHAEEYARHAWSPRSNDG